MYESNGIQRVSAAFRDGFSINFVHIIKPRVRFRDSKIKSLFPNVSSLRVLVLRFCIGLISSPVFHMSLPNTMDYLDESLRGEECPRSFSKWENFNRHVPNVFLLLLLYVHRRWFLENFGVAPGSDCWVGFNNL